MPENGTERLPIRIFPLRHVRNIQGTAPEGLEIPEIARSDFGILRSAVTGKRDGVENRIVNPVLADGLTDIFGLQMHRERTVPVKQHRRGWKQSLQSLKMTLGRHFPIEIQNPYPFLSEQSRPVQGDIAFGRASIPE